MLPEGGSGSQPDHGVYAEGGMVRGDSKNSMIQVIVGARFGIWGQEACHEAVWVSHQLGQ